MIKKNQSTVHPKQNNHFQALPKDYLALKFTPIKFEIFYPHPHPRRHLPPSPPPPPHSPTQKIIRAEKRQSNPMWL